MRTFLITLLCVLALSSTAIANATTVCGGGVVSSAGCGQGAGKGQAKQVPYLYLTASHVNANEPLTAIGSGFTPNTTVTVTIAVTGQAPYASGSTLSDARGNASVGIMFTGCGSAPPYDITVRFVDASGLNASARVGVC